MSLKSAIVVFATFAFRALASPAEPPQPQNPEDWSLLNFRRTCAADQSRCSYTFLVSEDPTKVPKYCNFDIDAAGGLPAYQTDFSSLKCPGVPEYTINGGWDEQGFITLTVINDPRKLLSFFAFRDDELWAGEPATPQTSKVFIYPMPAKREVEAREEETGLAYASSWKILDLIRYEFNRGAPYTDALIMSFGIQSGHNPIETCHIVTPLFEGIQPLGMSFANVACKYGGWTASWGHNETTDEAVMTLINANHDRIAYFGFNEVSTHIILGDNGPRPVSSF
ncbi:hypothetical protein CORC01_08278 [Colletotrichum orchidophilum]|uniref:Uncharacterized protein n=1 Tax=Colletotrichum orchidophilum TaxID=1209926 RepID=A0A1G4B4X7_9PEZI|nr:uncharacterized protein CORC01_08278 [Colletotrichum orchidophilum]OHE96355.1 hypothetical protein CORC01_08278 [Colletotrichum orchidophilum]